MRRLLSLAVALLVFSPTQLLADPLGNLGQLFPFVGFLFCVPCAIFTWTLAYRGTGRQRFRSWLAALIAMTVLSLLALTGFGASTASFLFRIGFIALIVASPLLCLWCALWWVIASRAYRRLRVPPFAIAVVGIMTMVTFSCALIWTIFPGECRHMFRL